MAKPASAVIVLGLLTALAACGGSGGGSSTTTPPPSGGGGGTTTPSPNPCIAALASGDDAQPLYGAMAAAGQASPVTGKKPMLDSDPRGRALEALFIHQAAERARAEGRLTTRGAAGQEPVTTQPEAGATVSADSGNIAVIQDSGDLILPANPFDMQAKGLRFTPSGGGYAVSKIDATFRSSLGTRVILGDDDSIEIDVPFAFSFYGGTQKAAFVNSDGNITFGESDTASTDRDIARLLTGAPRVAPFLSDLDPSSGGKVFVNAASDQYTVTWCGVPAFGSSQKTTAQATLLPDGAIEFKLDVSIGIGDAVIGLSPGHTATFTASDLDVPNPSSGGGAIAERFATHVSLDTIAVAKKFYATHADNYDQLLYWSDQPLILGAFAYELTVANAIKGLGQDVYDLSHDFGSGGALSSLVMMDWLGKYPDDPTARLLGENNTLSVMGQEVGHRWLAYLNLRDFSGNISDVLLGRDLAHWSFFFNSDASVMEGNEIQDLGGGQFKTTDAVKRYSRLDQYAMGLIPPANVPPMFYVDNPVTSHTRADAPQIGVTFTGTRRDFLIKDITDANGDRSPSYLDSPRTWRQAFIYIVGSGHTLDNAQVTKLDKIRSAWESFFAQATEQRMSAVTSLR